MNVDRMLSRLDELFATNQLDKVEPYLVDQLKIAQEEPDEGAALSILNELIGYYREFTEYDKAEETVEKALELIRKCGLEESLSHGTTLLNAANAYRAMGKLKESEDAYQKVECIYRKELMPEDFRFASLYNNMSLLFQADGQWEKASESLSRALEIVKMHPDAVIELAVTYTNLGQVYLSMGKVFEAEESLLQAEEIFARTEKKDYHYCGCANALGELYLIKEDYEKAVCYYEEALLNMHETAGMTANYQTIRENLMKAYEKAGRKTYDNMLDLCEDYYEIHGKKMIAEKFPQYVDKIAVGLCGEGSECFGFDDEISTDHDCGPGFAMWMTQDVFDAIGGKLNEEYEKLPKVFAGRIRSETAMGRHRCGAVVLDDFFERVLGRKIPVTEEDWRATEEYGLAAAVNGRVFTDPEGIFTEKREYLLHYYPRNVWLEKIARELMKCAQAGQYNYGRCMARKDYVTAGIALSEYMQSVMQLVFLLNRKFAPYYKWRHTAMASLPVLPEIGDILTAIGDMPSQREAWKDYHYNGNVNPNDMVAMSIEIIARLIVQKLSEMKLTSSGEVYLEAQAREVASRMEQQEEVKKGDKMTRQDKIDAIVKMEWEEFDKVQNEGGRADCQDDWDTFSIMRKSQYMTWTDEMLTVFMEYFESCRQSGRNLITEKYGRMMESTVPWEYEKIKDAFPVIPEEQKQIMEEIIKIQVAWMEEFSKEYPNMAGNARSIHTSEDRVFNTSYETYLRGELGTYSEEMLVLYGRFVAQLAKEGKNLARLTMENTAKLYGYETLDSAEKSLIH